MSLLVCEHDILLSLEEIRFGFVFYMILSPSHPVKQLMLPLSKLHGDWKIHSFSYALRHQLFYWKSSHIQTFLLK